MAVPLRKPIGGRLFMAARAAALCAGVCSCSLILGLQPLEITNWYPRNARIAASAVSDIWVEFSTGVDATKAEQALSLSENGAPMAGSYSWRGNRLVLTPARPVSPGNDYEIAVVSTAETKEAILLPRISGLPLRRRQNQADQQSSPHSPLTEAGWQSPCLRSW